MKVFPSTYWRNVARTKARQDTVQICRAFSPLADLGKQLVMLLSMWSRKNSGIIAIESLPSTASMGSRNVIQDRQTSRAGGIMKYSH